MLSGRLHLACVGRWRCTKPIKVLACTTPHGWTESLYIQYMHDEENDTAIQVHLGWSPEPQFSGRWLFFSAPCMHVLKVCGRGSEWAPQHLDPHRGTAVCFPHRGRGCIYSPSLALHSSLPIPGDRSIGGPDPSSILQFCSCDREPAESSSPSLQITVNSVPAYAHRVRYDVDDVRDEEWLAGRAETRSFVGVIDVWKLGLELAD